MPRHASRVTTVLSLPRVLPGSIALAAVAAGAIGLAQNSQLPNPYRAEHGWARMPEGRVWGSTSAVDIDRDGHIWVAERCGANTCAGSFVFRCTR